MFLRWQGSKFWLPQLMEKNDAGPSEKFKTLIGESVQPPQSHCKLLKNWQCCVSLTHLWGCSKAEGEGEELSQPGMEVESPDNW